MEIISAACFLGSHQSSLLSSATAWTQDTPMAPISLGTTPDIIGRIRGIASSAQHFAPHRFRRSFNVRRVSILTRISDVASLTHRIKPCTTLLSCVRFSRSSYLWPRRHVNSASTGFAVSNCSPLRFTHSKHFAVHSLCFLMT